MIVGDSDTSGDIGPAALHRLREPEVEHLHRTVRSNFDIGRLQVPVDDALLVRRRQRLGDLFRDRQRLVECDSAVCDPVRERRSLDQFHHERENAVRLLEAVNVRDVRMVQGGEDFGFTLKPGEAVRVRRHALRQHLDRHLAFQVRVGGSVDFAHPAGPECADDLVGAEPCAALKGQRLAVDYIGGAAARRVLLG